MRAVVAASLRDIWGRLSKPNSSLSTQWTKIKSQQRSNYVILAFTNKVCHRSEWDSVHLQLGGYIPEVVLHPKVLGALLLFETLSCSLGWPWTCCVAEDDWGTWSLVPLLRSWFLYLLLGSSIRWDCHDFLVEVIGKILRPIPGTK